MTDRRKKNANWLLNPNADGTVPHHDAELAVLMDIRDELQKLNAVFACYNFQQVPNILREIQTNTKRRRKKRVVGRPKLRVVR